LKQKLGLGHFEGRSWRGFHHHAALCMAAYRFLVADRSRFFLLGPRRLDLSEPPTPEG
jgi:SRSO17 transposase